MPLITTTGTALALAGLSALGTMGATAGQMFYNKAEAQRNRDFQKEMRDTSLESVVNQATRLGISPSLVLGNGSTALGGSQASVSGNKSAMASGVGQFIDYLKNKDYLKTLEEMNEDRIQNKMSNTVGTYQGRKYKKGELDNLFDNLDNINLFE